MRVGFIIVILCISTCAVAAPRRLGMTREKDVTESPDNEVTVSVSVDGKDSDAYVPYIRDGSSEWTNSLVSVSFCCVAKEAFTDEDKVRIACQGTGELYEKVNGSYRRVTSREYLCSNIGSKEFVLHGHSISSSIGDGAVSITYTKDAASSSVSYTVYSAVFVTPAGDPVNSPVDSGDGQNEFTYSNDAIGVLSIGLKAQMLPSGASPSSTGNICFEVGDVGDSTKNWCHENPDGRASISGDELSAHVTFRNLPSHNSDFGKKIARVRCEGRVCGEADYEVFYFALACNHPGGVSSDPNWFYYYKQNAGGGGYSYINGGRRSRSISTQGDTSILIGDEAYAGDRYIVTRVVFGQLLASGWSDETKYYANFLGVLAHERHHANNEVRRWCSDDCDGDSLSSNYEVRVTFTDFNDKFSARGVLQGPNFDDSEIYAGGPVEQQAIQTADTSYDWAKPGTNSHP